MHELSWQLVVDRCRVAVAYRRVDASARDGLLFLTK